MYALDTENNNQILGSGYDDQAEGTVEAAGTVKVEGHKPTKNILLKTI